MTTFWYRSKAGYLGLTPRDKEFSFSRKLDFAATNDGSSKSTTFQLHDGTARWTSPLLSWTCLPDSFPKEAK